MKLYAVKFGKKYWIFDERYRNGNLFSDELTMECLVNYKPAGFVDPRYKVIEYKLTRVKHEKANKGTRTKTA